MAPLQLRIDGATFRDPQNRQITLHGVNVASDAKLPAHPDVPSHVRDHFFEGDTVSFVDRPFPVSDAHTHFSRLRRWGYNCIRYIYTWEAIEHEGPGKYDEAFIDHTIEILRIAGEYGFYIFMDPHQDVWSRFTGGSGAPLWTLYACGFNPENFAATQASLVHNTWPDPAQFPRMVWATNYNRLAAQTMFTMFFSGRDFAPKCVIDGQNIQDWLQDHFIGACRHLAQRIHATEGLSTVVIGHENINEPSKGYAGYGDISKLADAEDQRLRKDTTPSGWQAMLIGAGRAVEVETWDFGTFGPYKSGTQLVDPQGKSAWLDPTIWDDSKYGWKRADSWKLGECVWAQHGVWDASTDDLSLPHYFEKHPETGKKIDMSFWMNHYFMDHYRKYRSAIRQVWPESIILMQPTPYEIPPSIKGTKDDDANMVFSAHFYDGVTLITKKWNRIWNVDVIGVLRGRYSNPAFAIKIGENAIRNCFRDELSAIRQEGTDNLGNHPCMFTEIGIPYDMDKKKAYETGNYSSQIAALDANAFALEGSQVQGFTWWAYCVNSSHFWGDNWNGEDLSIYCSEDRALPLGGPQSAGKTSLDPSSPSYSASLNDSGSSVGPGNLQKTLSVTEMSRTATSQTTAGAPGFRAAEAYVRPTPVFTHGDIDSFGFDLKNCTFTLALTAKSPTLSDFPTEIFLPDFHFPQQQTHVEVSGGKWEIRVDDSLPNTPRQLLRWWHAEGEQKLTIKGLKRKNGALPAAEADESYLEAYWQMGKSCSVM